ncbi:MAG: 23S rRNA (pseudouridine(1915)-N(3))-methyltransferase RlmH [Acidihalobacter sp.]|uniref:23S rRNA (pseudouridine(1915)-N(3))-methyltransferase RlmH n=1 Tax=Acidihalobacter sp. TaxID=1872108 RepID=UPI00307CE2F4
MRIHLIAIGQRMPAWVQMGYEEYAARMPAESSLQLVDIPPEKRTRKADLARIAEREAERLQAATPRGARIVALDASGRMVDTPALAGRLERWMQDGRDVALWVGGPEGLTDKARAQAEWLWSLSPLTFPHPLVRVLVAEQLYRASSIIRNHPYHRE